MCLVGADIPPILSMNMNSIGLRGAYLRFPLTGSLPIGALYVSGTGKEGFTMTVSLKLWCSGPRVYKYTVYHDDGVKVPMNEGFDGGR